MLNTFTITRSNLAGLVDVTEKGTQNGLMCVYLHADCVEAYRGGDMSRDVFGYLPKAVRAAVLKHFEAVFAVPIGKRTAYLASLPQSFEVTI